MNITPRRVQQLTSGHDLSPPAAPTDALSPSQPQNGPAFGRATDAEITLLSHPTASPPPEPHASIYLDCPEPGCAFRTDSKCADAVLDRHIEMQHSATTPSPTPERREIPRRYRHLPTVVGSPVWPVLLDDCPAVLGYNAMHRRDGFYEHEGGYDHRGKPRSCFAAIRFLTELGDIVPGDSTSPTRRVKMPDGSHTRAVCFRRSWARQPAYQGDFYDEPPESDREVRLLLVKRLDQHFGSDRPGYLLGVRDLVPA
jgi:hypothetical protein